MLAHLLQPPLCNTTLSEFTAKCAGFGGGGVEGEAPVILNHLQKGRHCSGCFDNTDYAI
jgi:hypothetical protein